METNAEPVRVEVRGLVRAYRSARGREVRALDGVDLEVPAGTPLCVAGASGSGKTTLLRLIAGLEDPDGGEVLLDGTPVGRIPPARRRISLLFQDAALYPDLPVYDNLAVCLSLRRRRAAPLRARVEAMAERCGIAHRLDALPDRLSRGERQRVALGRALLSRPALLLLDEPLSSLDPELRFFLRLEIAALQRSTGATMVHVTHDPFEAFTLGERVAVLHQGRLLQQDTPEGIRLRPADRHVAAFSRFPPMNFVPGYREGESWVASARPALRLSLRPPVPDGAMVTAGIPPEAVEVFHGAGGIEATLARLESFDGRTIFYADIGDLRLVGQGEASPLPNCGSRIRVGIGTGEVLWFDAGTSRRIEA